MVQAQNDHILYKDETKDILFDKLTFRAYNLTWNLKEYNLVQKFLKTSGLNQIRSGKSTITEKIYKDFRVSHTYQKRSKRWSLYFTFETDFDLKLCYSLMTKFLERTVHLDLANHKIEFLGSSELTIDIKNFDPKFIENLSKAIDNIRDKNQSYKSAIVDNRFIKLYLKNKKIRLETKLGSKKKPIKAAIETLEDILHEKEKLLDEEIQETLDLQDIIKLLLEIKGSLDHYHFLLTELNTKELQKIIQVKHNFNVFQSNLLKVLDELRLNTDFLHSNLRILTKNQELMFMNLQQYQDKITDFFEFNINVNNQHFDELKKENSERFDNLALAFNRNHVQKLQMIEEFNSIASNQYEMRPPGIAKISWFSNFISYLTSMKELLIKIGDYLMKIFRIGKYRLKQSSSHIIKLNKMKKGDETLGK